MARLKLNLKNNIVAIDTETTGLNPWNSKSRKHIAPDRAFAYSFCDAEGNTDYIRFDVDGKTRQVLPNRKGLLLLNNILYDNSIAKIFHNIGFDYRMIKLSTGITPKGKVHDTIFLSHIATGGSERSYALKPLALKYLEIPEDDQKDLIKSVHSARRKAKKEGWAIATKETHGLKPVLADYWLGDPKLCAIYAKTDAYRTMGLYQLFYDEVQNDSDLKRVYQRELNLFWVINSMENRGCRVHPSDINRLRKYYQNYMNKQMKLVHKNGGKGLNFNSPKQMHHKFYKELKFKPKYNDDGNTTLDSKQLVKLAKESPLAKAILEWKAGDHMLSAFLNPYEKFMAKEKGEYILHPNYRQVGPATGRISCSDPNLMNVASEKTGDRKADIALKPRECLGPRKGHVWYLPDWSQIEVWIFAFLSKEKTMIKTLLSGKHFHTANAEKIWGNRPDYKEKIGIYKKKAKGLFFGRLYGGGKRTAANTLDCKISEAIEFIAEFDEALPGVTEFISKISDHIKEKGWIKNPFGRLYRIHGDYAYKGVNYLIQGTAADIAKRAMIRLYRLLKKDYPKAKLILMFHDEFVIEVPKANDTINLRKAIIEAMQVDNKKLGIPIKIPVEMDLVKSRWSSAIPLCKTHLTENCTCKKG